MRNSAFGFSVTIPLPGVFAGPEAGVPCFTGFNWRLARDACKPVLFDITNEVAHDGFTVGDGIYGMFMIPGRILIIRMGEPWR
jgi:hypothetical protein